MRREGLVKRLDPSCGRGAFREVFAMSERAGSNPVLRIHGSLRRSMVAAAGVMLGTLLLMAPAQRAEALSLASPSTAALSAKHLSGGLIEVRGGHGGGHGGGGFHGGGGHGGGGFHGGGFHRGGFVGRPHVWAGHRAYFHRRHFFRPRFYGGTYPYFYHGPRCRIMWTHYGPRRICRWHHRHHRHWRHRHWW
jgi:hypothetical protein